MRLPTDIVSKLGLVVNEFVTNAVKHGCGLDGCDTVIRVGGHARDGMLVLEVADNGAGLPQDFDIGRIKGLGMRLVRFVASSLGGESGARNGEVGAIFFVAIPLPRSARGLKSSATEPLSGIVVLTFPGQAARSAVQIRDPR